MPNTVKFSEITQIQAIVVKKSNDINKAGINISLKQMIPYGTQINLENQSEKGLINIYYSKKKGLSFVDCSKNSVSGKTISIFRGESLVGFESVSDREMKLNAWIGTDESGKGDFFGPLVVAGFFINRDIEKEIINLGATDSKKLTSKKIHEIAYVLQRDFSEHISIVAPSNIKYNELYDKFKNLNSFLGWGHARVIQNLYEKWHIQKNICVDGVVADQFGNERIIKNALSSIKNLNIIQRPRGESNTAVAAASIIARSCFENKIFKLQKEYSFKIPFGAGANVLLAAKEFARNNGKDALRNIVKTHFKTFREV